MANIRLDLDSPIYDGQALTFKSPVDCSSITGLIVYYLDSESTSSQVFQFADAHGNNIGDLDLFASDSIVKIILDTEHSLAFVQNADTNAYLEGKFNELNANKQGKHKSLSVTLSTSWSNLAQTVSVAGVTANNTVFVAPAPASYSAYCKAGVYCFAQASGSLTFKCTKTPSASLTVNVTILD